VLAAVEKWGGAVFGLIPRYWFHVSIQNGDGVGTVATTFKASRSVLTFDATKTMKVSSVGLANRFWEFGFLQETVPGDPLGYDGIDLTVGAAMTLDGNIKIYGTKMRVIGANLPLIIRRNSTSEQGDIVGLTIDQLATGTPSAISIGSNGVPMARCHHFYPNVLGAATASVSLFNVTDAKDPHFGGISATRIAGVTNYTLIRDGSIVGTPATADLRGSSGGTDLIDFTWSAHATQVSTANLVNDWRTCLPTVVNQTTWAPEAGVTFEILDGTNTVLVTATTDSQGQISYTLPGITGISIVNAIKARTHVTVWTDNGPFTFRVSKTGFATSTTKFVWPRSTGTFGDQLYAVRDVFPIRPLSIGPTADFRKSPGGGLPGVTVQFTDESLPGDAAITAWAWDFGDGFTSTVQNPIHVYAIPGSYDVTLQVTNPYGTSSKTVLASVFVAANVVVVSAPAQYVRQPVASTPYTPVSGPVVPFVPKDAPVTAFQRTIGPDSAFTPCSDDALSTAGADQYVLFGLYVIPIQGKPVYEHLDEEATAFTPSTIPAVGYSDCGADGG
jgi:PKD repeat protein